MAEVLAGKRIPVAGVSPESRQAVNAIYRKLRASGYEVLPINPRAPEVEGARCYPTLHAVPGPVDGLVVATPPHAGVALGREAAQCGVPCIWFHRSLGRGSVSGAAVREAETRGLHGIVGGCPLM